MDGVRKIECIVDLADDKKFIFIKYRKFNINKMINSDILIKDLEDKFGILNVNSHFNSEENTRRIVVRNVKDKDVKEIYKMIEDVFPDVIYREYLK